jgi:CarboxypepD_reg-like domain/TonB-dependent Receptor Plug Domain
LKGSITIFFILIATVGFAQKVRLSGTVKERGGPALPLAHILVLPDSVSTIADDRGSYTISIPPGEKTIMVSYVGYLLLRQERKILKDITLDFALQPEINELDEVIVNSTRFKNEELLKSTRSSTNTISSEDIGAIPVLGGEADVIKTLQLLPGTVRGVEGSSDLFVRGGAADQNLVLLDGATVYNTSHLFGFLSVFNPDVVSEVESINGAFPANYGGRLSSILNVNTRNTIPDRTHASADIGLIASRIFIEQPLIKDKMSIWLSGRRTYIDKVVKLVDLEVPYYFYDLNGKILFQPTGRDKISLVHYNGDDRLDYLRDRNGDGVGQTTGFHSGNNSQTLHWNRDYDSNWHHEATLFRTSYRYDIYSDFRQNQLRAFSDIQDLGAKFQLANDSLSRNSSLSFGGEYIHHRLSPNVINTSGTIAELLKSSSSRGRIANELAAFVQYELQPIEKVRVSLGMRGSAAIVGSKNYFNPEPRLAVRYMLNEKSSLKASYSRMSQYLHRVSSSAVSSPTDIWYPVTDSIKPQTANQVGVAYQRNIPKYNAMFSVEAYYKKMHQLVGYEEGTNLFFNTDFESSLIQGDGKSYGFEFLLRKQAGKFTGWINYTLSWSWRRYATMNDGDWFHARYDRRHNGAVVMQYAFAKRWSVSTVWEYISGSRFTPVIGQYAVTSPSLAGIDLVPVFAPINSVRLSDAHRLDFGVKYRSKPGKFVHWQIFAGVYNAYNRANPVGIIVLLDETTGQLKYQQPGLFGLLPFISYGIKF